MSAAPLTEFAVHLRPNDNIAVCRRPISAGTDISFDGTTIHVPAAIKMGHKFAVRPIEEGDAVLKYGQIIGFASRTIAPGEHVHVHNVKLGSFQRDYAHATQTPAPLPPPSDYRSFMGYDRGAGRPDHLRYGTRNYLAVISTVNCSASTSNYIAE
ncbi:MAG TPA: SAF domain-containing protein, partial [Gemmata sp.]|nr:SAF domain-containing protein [Gemmata sp.]